MSVSGKEANKESEHDVVYGKPFSAFSQDEMKSTVSNYAGRFKANDIDPGEVFSGKRCLDAGCGYGRGSLFMLQNGATSVDAVDVSPTNVETAKKNLTAFGFENVNFHLTSIESLPFEDETFDVVWCYGVVHHGADTDACLKEISRVLKVGGQMKLFVYGSDGVFWYSIRRFREILKDISSEACLEAMRLIGVSTIDVSNYIDSWKTAYLRCYTHQDLGARLEELGFAPSAPQPYGLGYDQNHRKAICPEDAVWMGEGDLRYLLTKMGTNCGDAKALSNAEYGSEYPFAPAIVNMFGPIFDSLSKVVHGNPALAIAACRSIHEALFARLRDDPPFDAEAYKDHCLDVIHGVEAVKKS